MQTTKRELPRWLSLQTTAPRARQQRRGQTLVEYGLILAVVSIVAIGVLVTLGGQTKSLFSAVSSQISRAGGS